MNTSNILNTHGKPRKCIMNENTDVHMTLNDVINSNATFCQVDKIDYNEYLALCLKKYKIFLYIQRSTRKAVINFDQVAIDINSKNIVVEIFPTKCCFNSILQIFKNADRKSLSLIRHIFSLHNLLANCESEKHYKIMEKIIGKTRFCSYINRYFGPSKFYDIIDRNSINSYIWYSEKNHSNLIGNTNIPSPRFIKIKLKSKDYIKLISYLNTKQCERSYIQILNIIYNIGDKKYIKKFCTLYMSYGKDNKVLTLLKNIIDNKNYSYDQFVRQYLNRINNRIIKAFKPINHDIIQYYNFSPVIFKNINKLSFNLIYRHCNLSELLMFEDLIHIKNMWVEWNKIDIGNYINIDNLIAMTTKLFPHSSVKLIGNNEKNILDNKIKYLDFLEEIAANLINYIIIDISLVIILCKIYTFYEIYKISYLFDHDGKIYLLNQIYDDYDLFYKFVPIIEIFENPGVTFQHHDIESLNKHALCLFYNAAIHREPGLIIFKYNYHLFTEHMNLSYLNSRDLLRLFIYALHHYNSDLLDKILLARELKDVNKNDMVRYNIDSHRFDYNKSLIEYKFISKKDSNLFDIEIYTDCMYTLKLLYNFTDEYFNYLSTHHFDIMEDYNQNIDDLTTNIHIYKKN